MTNPESDAPTLPSSRGCDHKDMAGDSAVDVAGERRWCTICGAYWLDKDIVVVNDEVA